jgi:hypothetical protein
MADQGSSESTVGTRDWHVQKMAEEQGMSGLNNDRHQTRTKELVTQAELAKAARKLNSLVTTTPIDQKQLQVGTEKLKKSK